MRVLLSLGRYSPNGINKYVPLKKHEIQGKVTDMDVENPGGPMSPDPKKQYSPPRPWSEEEQFMTTTTMMTTMRYRREKVFAHRYVYETVVAQRARVRGVFAKRGSTIGNKCKEFVDRDLNAAIIIR